MNTTQLNQNNSRHDHAVSINANMSDISDRMYSNQSNLHSTKGINANMSDISDRIAKIIHKRQQLATRVVPVYQHLKTLLQEIKLLSQHRRALQTTLDNPQARESLDKINLISLETEISTNINELEQLQQRFSRPTLNIGVVGWTGQGKSTFLKSLSGLGDEVIPALPGGPCTAVRSKIEHHNGETQPIVIYHSQSSFLAEVIAPYYEKLGLGKPPESLDDFGNQPLPKPLDGIINQITYQTMYEHLLNDYYLPFNQYSQDLQSELREEFISKDKIRDYVVQRRDEHNRLITFKHLAVREVKILCRFAKTEVSKLGLIDVPGLGDTRLGDEDLLLKTLGWEVDIVLFLRRPPYRDRYLWDNDDIKLYDTTTKALPDLGDRAFLVINDEGDKPEASRFLRDNVGKMKFVGREIANCANPDEANQILERILHYLDREIEQLEQKYAQSRQNSLIALHQSIKSELAKASQVMRPFTQDKKLFRRLFKEFMQNLSNGLRDLLETLAQEQKTVDVDFAAVVKIALAACENDTGIPSEEKILNRARSELHNSYNATYSVFVPELRAHLSKNFLTLDDGLQQAANQLKERVAQVLIEKGGLGNLTDARGVEFLDSMTQMLAEQGNQLELGFGTLTRFNISYGALILRLIRQNLMSVLDPDEVVKNHQLREAAAQTVKVIAETGVAIGVPATTGLSPELVGRVVETADQLANTVLDSIFELNPKTVRGNLQNLHQQALNKCRETLERWLEAPSEIRYYMATEFVDRVLDAEEMRDYWDEFLREPEICAKVWPEFSRIEQIKKVQQSWLDVLKQVLSLNQRSQFEFLH